ncbi:long-chain acyl-CoA synthetase [Psychrobacter sp. PL15]|uniref:AMP-binding protein n=1 Tax=Psychrobacter sp. PL15 TaxID=3071719 RepID=UPI002E03ED7E|nr:long-chain acyl-CoA synthetase [Psychrobacter sp. PL15]
MNKIWTDSYPEGVRSEMTCEHKTLPDFFDKVFAKYAQKEFSTNMGVTYSYDEINNISRDIAAWLQTLGLARGATIGIMMPNVNQYLPVVIGVIRVGLVLTSINPLYTARELKHQLTDSNASAIFILEPFCETLEKVVNDTEVKTVIISMIGDMLGTVKGTVVNLAAKHIKKAIPSHGLKSNSKYKVLSFKSVVKQGKALPYSRPVIQPDDLAILQYTGGTTGVAKGLLVSNYNVVIATTQFEEWFKPVYKKLPRDTQVNTIIALPLYHIYAFILLLLGVRVGQHLTLVTNPRDIDGFVKILGQRPFHILPAVNTLYQALLNNDKFKTLDFSNLKLSLSGGMAATPATAKKWKDTTGLPILEGWGMSEGLGVGTANPLDNTDYNGNIGLPLPGVEIDIRDDEGNILALGEVGEMCIKGDNIVSGYHNIDNAGFFTADGYLKTGDVASMNEQGFIQIYDRKKDMLIVSGFNVFPNEVENVIGMHPKVAECSVVGVDDEDQGQTVKAYVVKSDSSLTEQDIKDFCKESLTGYKRPRHVEFIDELPKSTVGKILRHELRKKASAAS